MMGEYLWSDQAAKLTNEDDETSKGRLTNEGGFLQASWVLTGEEASYKGVIPANNFDFVNGNWGAFEIAARGSWVDLGDEAFEAGFVNPATSVGSAVAYTAGLNWYWNPNFKVQLNYERTEFNRPIQIDGATRSREDVLLARFQVSY